MEIKPSPIITTAAALILLVLASACSLVEVCPTAEPCPPVDPCPTQSPSIVGTWEGDVSGTTINFTFEASGTFIFYMQGDEVDRGQYALLETIHPIGINLIYEGGDVLYSIIEFINPDAMRMENVLPGDPRPIAFTDSYTFRRTNP